MTRFLEELPDEERSRVEEEAFPEWSSPMLATLTHEPFSDPDWIYERKLDGVRLLAFREGGRVRLLSRNRKEQGSTWPELVVALEERDGAVDLVADGEVVAFEGLEGKITSFSRLQGRMQIQNEKEAREKAEEIRAYLYLFDLLHLDGHDLTQLPLRTRKRILRSELEWEDPIRFTPHRVGEGEAFLREACEKGWEGLIAKAADGTYMHGRSRKWLKFKCVNRQEFVVGGWTDPQGERVGLGALLVGYHDEGSLRYAGKVGTGYTDEMLERLRSRLGEMERDTPPFGEEEEEDLPGNGVHWAAPKLVCEVGFTEWTGDGKLRHPRFLGLREDKDPEEVVRERPGARPEEAA